MYLNGVRLIFIFVHQLNIVNSEVYGTFSSLFLSMQIFHHAFQRLEYDIALILRFQYTLLCIIAEMTT